MTRLPDSLIQYLRERREQEAALGLRGYGRKKVVEALAEIDDALKDVGDPSVRNHDEEAPGLLDLLNDDVGRVGQYDEIRHDAAAMFALENFALAIGIAFELGQAAVLGRADPAALARHRAAREGHRQGGKNGGGKSNKEIADSWREKATPTYQELRRKFPKYSANGLADRIIRKHGDITPGKTTVARWVGEMDERLGVGRWAAMGPRSEAL